MDAPRIYHQGVGMRGGRFSTFRRWLHKHARMIILGVGLALIAGQIGCQSSTSIKGAKSEASASSGTTRFSIKTAEQPAPAPVKVRVKIKGAH